MATNTTTGLAARAELRCCALREQNVDTAGARERERYGKRH